MPEAECRALANAARRMRGTTREAFLWTSPEGEEMVFDITGLNQYLESHQDGWKPIHFAMDYNVEVIAIANRDPELAKLFALAFDEDRTLVRRPVTLIRHEGHGVFVDGAHRLSLWLLSGWSEGYGRMAEESVWRRFLIKPGRIAS